MSTPLVSVIIATYNWSSVLPFSIGSVLQQTVSDIEVLVVGDCCTDNSEEVVASIGDPRVRWINLPVNSGHQAEPNNTGLRQARGKYVAYCGHDDLWMPHHLECLTAALDAGADLAYGVVRTVRPDGTEHAATAVPVPYTPGLSIPPSSVVHRQDLLQRVGEWQDYRKIPMDPEADLWQRMHQAGCAFAFVPRLTVIKLPASMRRDVYKIRPSHEQAAWLKRIQSEPDLEMSELAAMVLLAEQGSFRKSGTRPYRALCAEFLKETRERIRIRMTGAFSGIPHSSNMIEYRRRFKGLDRNP